MGNFERRFEEVRVWHCKQREWRKKSEGTKRNVSEMGTGRKIIARQWKRAKIGSNESGLFLIQSKCMRTGFSAVHLDFRLY